MSSTQNKSKLFTALFFASKAAASISCAAGPGDRGRLPGPPPEAIQACADPS